MVENENCLKKEQVTKEQAGDVELVRNDNEIEWFKSSFGRMYRIGKIGKYGKIWKIQEKKK